MSRATHLREPHALVTGPLGAGTAVAALSAIAPVSLEVAVTAADPGSLEPAVLALSYGHVHCGEYGALHLYATAEDVRVDAAVALVEQTGTGLLLLLDNQRPYPLRDMHFYLHSFAVMIERSALAIGISHLQGDTRYGLDDYVAELSKLSLRAPVFEVASGCADDLRLLTRALLASHALRLD